MVIPAAHGAEPSRAQAIIASLQRKYEAAGTLAADFEQENELRSLGQVTRAKGIIRLHKPGRIRVEYTEPEKQFIVADGSRLWVYTPRLKQVIESRMAGGASTPFLFLAGKGDLTKSFDVRVEEYGLPPRPDAVWKAGQPHRLALRPRGAEGGVQQMWLEVDPQSFLITGLDYTDPLGNRSRMRFSQIQEGVQLPASLFQFQVPEGVEVLRLPGAGPTGR